MGAKKIVVAACACLFVLGGIAATSAEAASPYGPTGLGSNLHRRFVLKQAVKRTQQGRPVSNRQIIWQTRPYSRGFIRTSRWGR